MSKIPNQPEPLVEEQPVKSLRDIVAEMTSAINPFVGIWARLLPSEPTWQERAARLYWNVFYAPFYLAFLVIFTPIAAIMTALWDAAMACLEERE